MTGWLVTLLTAALTLVWLGWPVWSSGTVADRATASAEAPWLLGAQVCLLILLGYTLWLKAGRTLSPYAPVPLLVACAVTSSAFLHPGASGVEFAFVFPLVAGALLGGPTGFLTGSAAALISAAAGGTIAPQLVGQVLVWGLWGLAGAAVRPLSTRTAWLLGALLCLPLGVLSGLLLNLTGWAGETGADVGAFVSGAPPLDALTRLLQYSWATSFGYDLTRGISSAVVFSIVGGPMLWWLRQGFDTRHLPGEVAVTPARRISPRTMQRRTDSASITDLWIPKQGDPDD
ncbi:energy-coupling factor transport system substrate-specific component [Tessaracoccus bendigoensis DSM 12906]|uniref:Energy-coupling factor transport system substrate-specific component n=1 Tax=Tessaracoccus bendigoensis DSM 12906 TaxID=1123357 RepID=A0A1M6FG86_9ACTN|nr:hypothetical protein [Tessaracoccus bendigoensis]SHI96612.1 energy-coupling factor transport system substrate-specific component [Tessaracoccus bendigoensis DSM 12906]